MVVGYAPVDFSPSYLPDFDFETNACLNAIEVTEKDVLDVLKGLDMPKATGPDGISAKMLKKTAVSIMPSLTRLIWLSLSSCKFPTIWKQANVSPIHKKGDNSDFGIIELFSYYLSEGCL